MNDQTALLVVDVQEGLDDPRLGSRNNPSAEENVARLLDAWRTREWPIAHVKHNSQRPDSSLRPDRPGNEIKSIVAPRGDETMFEKRVNSAFIGTDLEAHLRESGCRSVVVAGLTTNHCVSSTARMAGDLGFEVFVVSDATAAHEATGPDGTAHDPQTVHELALVDLHGEFATILGTDEILHA